jgi:hypothetical protein
MNRSYSSKCSNYSYTVQNILTKQHDISESVICRVSSVSCLIATYSQNAYQLGRKFSFIRKSQTEVQSNRLKYTFWKVTLLQHSRTFHTYILNATFFSKVHFLCSVQITFHICVCKDSKCIIISVNFLLQASPQTQITQWDLSKIMAIILYWLLKHNHYSFSKTSLRVCHTLSRQPYGNVLCVQRHFGSHCTFKTQTSTSVIMI